MQINSDVTFTASMDECFAQIIKNRGWYQNSPFDRKKAAYHKKMFIENRLPYEFKKIYLQSIGYEIFQPELWKKKPIIKEKPKATIIQPNIITMMCCDFTNIQMKVLIAVIDKLQSTIKEILNGVNFESTSIFKQIDSSNQLTVQIKYLELGIKPHKYEEVRTEIKKFPTIPVIFEKNLDAGSDYVKFIKIFLPDIPTKPYSGYFNIKIESSVLKQLVNVSQGFTIFNKKNALAASKYGSRIYMLISMWKDMGSFQMNLNKFRKWLQLEDKYPTYQELYKSVIQPVYEELFGKADCWFEVSELFNDGETEPYKLNFKVSNTQEININN